MKIWNTELLLIMLRASPIKGQRNLTHKVFLLNSLLTRNKIEQNFNYLYEKDFRYGPYTREIEMDLKYLAKENLVKISQNISADGVLRLFEITAKGKESIKYTEAPLELICEMLHNLSKIDSTQTIESRTLIHEIKAYGKVSLIK